MKNNGDTKVSIKFVTLLSLAIMLMITIFITYKTQQNTELADLKENTTIAKTESTSKNITSRASLTSRREQATKNEEKNNSETQTQEEIKEIAKEAVNETPKYIPISEVKISKSMDLTKTTGLSKEDFTKLISGLKVDTSGFFKNNSATIYDLCKKYQINEIFFCGLISAESGWNIASNHRRTYNYISLMSGGKLIQFSSVEEGLEAAAKRLHQNYLTPGGKFYHGKTLAGVKTRFCPVSSTWVDLVYGRMSQII